MQMQSLHEQMTRALENDPALLTEAERRNGRPVGVKGDVPTRELENFFSRFVILPKHAALPLALWTLMTHTFDCFDAVPYLVIGSPTPRCGKTRLLECLELVVAEPRRASNVSEAALFRMIEKFSPTLLLDEAETLNGRTERAEYLCQIINAGNRRGAKVTRCVGQGTNLEARDFSVFCPKVLAGIGNLPHTITDRAIVLSMQRRKDSESVERFLSRRVEPVGNALRMQAEAFVTSRREEISAAYEATDLAFISSDRDAEAWAPLFAILSIAAPERLPELRMCAEHLTHSKSANAEDDSLALRLLADMRDVWPEAERKIFTVELVRRLKGIEDAPWAGDERFDGRKLSRLLRPFELTAATVRIGTDTRKGYAREDAEAVFARYPVSQPSQASQPA
jgi:hypothetical protein